MSRLLPVNGASKATALAAGPSVGLGGIDSLLGVMDRLPQIERLGGLVQQGISAVVPEIDKAPNRIQTAAFIGLGFLCGIWIGTLLARARH